MTRSMSKVATPIRYGVKSSGSAKVQKAGAKTPLTRTLAKRVATDKGKALVDRIISDRLRYRSNWGQEGKPAKPDARSLSNPSLMSLDPVSEPAGSEADYDEDEFDDSCPTTCCAHTVEKMDDIELALKTANQCMEYTDQDVGDPWEHVFGENRLEDDVTVIKQSMNQLFRTTHYLLETVNVLFVSVGKAGNRLDGRIGSMGDIGHAHSEKIERAETSFYAALNRLEDAINSHQEP